MLRNQENPLLQICKVAGKGFSCVRLGKNHLVITLVVIPL